MERLLSISSKKFMQTWEQFSALESHDHMEYTAPINSEESGFKSENAGSQTIIQEAFLCRSSQKS